FVANRIICPVPAERRGAPGIHEQRIHAPRHVVSGSATAPATSAQYPHPVQPRTIETVTAVARATRSFLDTIEKRRPRFSRARCSTDALERKIVADRATATGATRGSPYTRASSVPAAANAIVSTRPTLTVIQNRL